MKKIIYFSILTVFLLSACNVNISNMSIDSKYKVKTYEEFQAIKDQAKEDYLAVERVETMKLMDLKGLEVATTFSDIEIIFEDREDVEIQYFAFITKDSLKTEPDYNISKKSDFVFEVEWKNFTGSAYGMMRIFLPESFKNDLQMTSISGNLYATSIIGEQVNLKTISGDIDIESLEAGDIDLQTISGHISMEDVVGKDLDIKSTSGDVEILKMVVKEIKADLISGDLKMNLVTLEDDLTIDSISGKVNLSFDQAPSASLNLKTVSGNISLAYTLDQIDINKDKSLKGQLEKGDHQIKIDTISGDIIIE